MQGKKEDKKKTFWIKKKTNRRQNLSDIIKESFIESNSRVVLILL